MSSSPTNKPNTTRIALITAAVVLAFIASYYARQAVNTSSDIIAPPSDYQRIIGLSPSIVEIIYQLEHAEQLVGVSRFCHYPPEASQKTVVGGYVDLDYEAVLTLKPDCVILLEEQRALAEKLEIMGVHTIILDHTSTQGVIDSIAILGKAFSKESIANHIVQTMHTRVRTLKHQARRTDSRPRILVCIERDTNSAFPDRVIAAGNKGVHQEYINMVNGVNAYQGPVAYPLLSREKLIHLNPDLIIELVREDVWKDKGRETLMKQWQAYNELKAVKNDRIIFLHEHQHMIPGPRFIDTLEVFAQAAALPHE
ncbi:MAG: ABC transporter substrate-binding protein [Verrucomicrobiae bacterium]|nr:ABC transporter substrate-binding protein [Verrucomicrobiae bacterium]NNJ43575.1 ABC transporter substrate-binding protein [Akkermansiaceae bacterium]